MKNAPIKERGIATTGMSTERKEPKNKYITTVTISNASKRDLTTS